MESAGHKSVGAAGGGDGSGGHLCHLCGYKYASAHPSAKQRRAHRKNCGGGGGKSPPAADATAEVGEEREGKKLPLDECEGEAGGEGNGAGASDSGGGFPGSAQDVGNAAADDDSGVHSSPNSAGVQVTINDVAPEVAPKANGTEIQTEVATQLSENAPNVEDLHPSESHVSGDQGHDASASNRQSEPEDGARFSSDLSADEMSKSNGVSVAPNAASDEISAQTSATVGGPDDVAFTEKDCMINIEEDKASEDMLVKGSEIVEGQSAATMDKDLCVNNSGLVSIDQIPSEETEPKEESGVIRTDSVEQALGNKEPCTDKHVHTVDTSSDDLSELDSGGCHLEAADVVKTKQQTDPTSVVAEQLANSKQTDIEERQSYLDADEVIQAAWSATGPAGSTGDLTKKESSGVTIEDGIQIDLVEPSSDPTSHEINMIISEDFDKNRTNENISADLTSSDTTQAQSLDAQETTSHETKAVCSTDDVQEIEQITAEVSPPESSILQSTSSVEEKEQIEEVVADPASYKVNVISGREIVVEKEQTDVYVGSANEINAVNVPATVELKEHNEETTRDPTACETNITDIADNVAEKNRNEETTTDPAPHASHVIQGPGNDDTSEVPSSHENAVVDGMDNVKEKDEDPTSCNMDVVSAVDVVEVKKQEEEVTAEPTHPEINAVHTVDNVKEEVTAEPTHPHPEINTVHTVDNVKEEVTAEPTHPHPEINAVHTVDNVKEKVTGEPTHPEEPAVSCQIDAGSNADSIPLVDPSSHKNNTQQGTDDAEEKNQKEEVAAEHAGNTILAAQSTEDDVAEKKLKNETVTAEINTTESANGDQNEEITDKEMTIDSDKSHVSLKSLLSEKGTETKEKKATSTKDRVLSFRRRSSKDNPSPGKPGSLEQDWNSPARLPVEKSPKGKKQPWMPFICCHSMN